MNRTQRQYQQQVHELNSTLKSRTSENSHLDFSQRNCLKSISALNNNLSKLENNITILNSELSELNQTHTDLRHECNQLETKYRAITETKNQICQYLSRRREQTCPPYWTEKEGWCYFISTSVKSYDGAREHCSKFDARLLEINSNVEKWCLSIHNVLDWKMGKQMLYGRAVCTKCDSSHGSTVATVDTDSSARSLHIYTRIFTEEIQGFCQHHVEPDLIK
ncbi:uncharacterized protein [Mobula birostris]|uniref:uncharacterized protein isoform X2 n=1 Tax=Mobula birostris TaxID=1983395 RepID=UPI003B283D3D